MAKQRKRPSLASAIDTSATAVGRAVATVVNTVTRSGPRDAVRLLEDDHRRLEALFEEGAELSSRAVKARTALFARLAAELEAHELIEEKIFYPALKNRGDAKDIVLEGYQEHHVADLLLAELASLSKSDERWGAKFKVLQENIEHHIEEEEGEMFKTARKVMSRAELEKLGGEMETLKQQTLQKPRARRRPASRKRR